MNTARILSIAAVAAFASIGAQAGQLGGELYGSDVEAGFVSNRTRAEVTVEATQAVANFKNFYVEPKAAQTPSALARTVVREQARIATRTHSIASGDFS